MRKPMLWIGVSAILIVSLLTFMWIYADMNITRLEFAQSSGTVYDRYYVLVADDDSDQLTAIYESARAYAAEQNVRLALAAEETSTTYTLQERMEIALAQDADGIILLQNEEEGLEASIETASGEQVPVVTVLNDAPDSDRISYVGINAYQMGDAYGSQALRAMTSDETDILVLMSNTSQTMVSSLAYAQMMQVIETGAAQDGRQVQITSLEVDSSQEFEAEETVRSIFVSSEQPDILICLDPVTTLCAIQAVTDYNEVGNVVIIGYYASSAILEAIPKGIVQATLAVNTEQIGRLCVDALDEYLELGYVSNYMPVEFEMVTAGNIEAYLEEEDREAG